MYLILIVFYDILVITSAFRSDEQAYCSLRYRRLCQGKGRHIACQFPFSGPGVSCRNYTQIKFTNELRHFVTHYINRRRQRIASGSERVRGGAYLPRPEVMMLVTWDKELTYLAQRLADQCHFVHDDCRATVRYPYAGQSVGEVRWKGGEELNTQRAIRRVLDAWWGEKRRVQTHQLITPFRLVNKGSIWGHFSQLAVWSLRAVGCAAVMHGWDYTRLLLVCDFSHTNMLGEKTISPGPMVPCPIHTMRKPRTSYPLLCAPVMRSTSSEIKDDYNYNDGTENDEIYQSQTTQIPSLNTKKYTSTYIEEKFTETKRNKLYLPRRNTIRQFNLPSKNTVQSKTAALVALKTTRLLVGKLERNDARGIIRGSGTLKSYNRWETWPTHPEIREDQESKGQAKLFIPYKKLTTSDDDVTVPEFHIRANTRARYHYKVKTSTDNTKGTSLRPRWRQTRIRPQRPGANALLNKPLGLLQRSTFASLMIDEEDVDQLFKDTGFNVHWRKQLQNE